VALTDNTTSLYSSTGGGTIGGGGHQAVADATQALLDAAERQLAFFLESDDTSHPPFGSVRIFVVTPSGRRVADVPDDAFWSRADHRLRPVIDAAQNVVTKLRTV